MFSLTPTGCRLTTGVMTKPGPDQGGATERRSREERLAKALRENLRRRKVPTPPPEAAEKPRD
jgi:hypothetical protein